MNKILKFILIFFISLFMCACGLSEKQELTFSTWGSHSEIKIVKTLIEKFENENNVKVKLIHIPQNYFQKLHLLFASNQAPDVMFLNNYYLGTYQNANLLEDLTPYFQKELHDNVFFENAISSLTINSELYAVPRDISNVVVFYNKDLFDRYQIKYPDETWTYDDLLEIGRLFKAKNIYPIGIEEHPIFWEPILWAYGGSIFDKTNELALNTSESLSALKKYIDLKNYYDFIPAREAVANKTMAQMFLNQEIAMHVSGRWLVPKYRDEADFKWDVINLPNGPRGVVSSSDTSGWSISKTTKKLDLAVKFVKYLSSSEVISQITKMGLITPARKDVAYSSVFLDENLPPKNAIIFVKNNDNAKISIIPEKYNQKIEKLMKVLEPYFLGKEKLTPDTKFEL